MLIYLTSLNASGLRDWVIQRVTAVLLAAYVTLLFGFLLTHSHLTYDQWHAFFTHTLMRVFTLFILFSLLFHAWIGFWIISTDYLKKTCIRLSFQFISLFFLLACFIAGILIMWGS